MNDFEERISAALEDWANDQTANLQTRTRATELVMAFVRRATALDVTTVEDVTTELVRDFVDAPTRYGNRPSISARHARRSAIRKMWASLRELDLAEGDPTLDIGLPPKPVSSSVRPLTDAEVTMARQAVWNPDGRAGKRAVAWALAEAGATSSEIVVVRAASFDSPTDPTLVELPGAKGINPRVVPLTSWGCQVVADRLLTDDGGAIAYGGDADAQSSGQSAAGSELIRAVLGAIGLDPDPAAKPTSVRKWRAQTELASGRPLPEVALLMGLTSLDRAASLCDWDWTSEFDQ